MSAESEENQRLLSSQEGIGAVHYNEEQSASEPPPDSSDPNFKEEQTIYIASMTTTVASDGIHVRYRPVIGSVKRTYLFDDILAVEKTTYSGIGDFGGWGIRENRTSKAMTCSGSEAIALTLRGKSKKVLLGTKCPDELLKAIKVPSKPSK